MLEQDNEMLQPPMSRQDSGLTRTQQYPAGFLVLRRLPAAQGRRPPLRLRDGVLSHEPHASVIPFCSARTGTFILRYAQLPTSGQPLWLRRSLVSAAGYVQISAVN